MKPHALAAFVLLTICFAACCKDDVAKPDDMNVPGLPPVTQNGANTLGFLLNGQPWTPEGNNGTGNLSMDYDPGIRHGYVSIAAEKLLPNHISQFIIGIRDSLNFSNPAQQYHIGQKQLGAAIFTDTNFCERRSDDNSVFSKGYINISKLDRIGGIIAGTFEVTLFNPQCGDTIRITKGRFDMKF